MCLTFQIEETWKSSLQGSESPKIFNLLGYEIEFLSVYYFLSLIKKYSWFMVFNEWFPVMFLNEKMGSSVSVFNNEENWW